MYCVISSYQELSLMRSQIGSLIVTHVHTFALVKHIPQPANINSHT